MSAGEGLAVRVESYGLRRTVGPFDGLPEAMRFVSDHLADTDHFRHTYEPLTDVDEAADQLHRIQEDDPPEGLFDMPARERREPLEAALRDAIARKHGLPGDGGYGDGLYAVVDVHRPWRVELKDEECWDGSCEHGRDRAGNCVASSRYALWCRGCTPVYRCGGEWDGNPYGECQVDWPCSPVVAMCGSFGVSLTGKALDYVPAHTDAD